MVEEHIEKHTFTEVIIDCGHGPRTESAEFRHARKTIKQDGFYYCYVCGATEKIEEHHYGCEWSKQNEVDYDKLKAYLLEHDIYGYSHKMINEPLTTVDDVRNQMMLCVDHHRMPGTGIHYTTPDVWVMQKICKTGQDPVPQRDESIKTVEGRIKQC
jgi:hypothetical protein